MACAQVTQADMVGDGLTQGGTAGDSGTAGTGATAGDGSISGSGGSGDVPVAGSTTGGGGVATAGSDAGGVGGMAGGGMGGGGMGGAGGASAGMGGGGAGGSGSTGHRYVRFVAKSEQTGKQWSSCAELGLLTTGGVAIPRSGWSVMADSQETDDEQVYASNAIDGDINTFWHTEWEPAPDDVNDAKLPHQLVIDLGSAKPITGFSYTPRQVGVNGHIKDWEIYVSNTNGSWGAAVDSGSFPAGIAVQTITF